MDLKALNVLPEETIAKETFSKTCQGQIEHRHVGPLLPEPQTKRLFLKRGTHGDKDNRGNNGNNILDA